MNGIITNVFEMCHGIIFIIFRTVFQMLPITTNQISPISLDVHIDGNKNGPMLFFIHGFPDNYTVWDKQINYLKNNYLCIRITLPNYNTNNIENKYGFDFNTVYNSIRNEIELQLKKFNKKSLTLIMHDFGSIYGYRTFKILKNKSIIKNIVFIEVADIDDSPSAIPYPMCNKYGEYGSIFQFCSLIFYQFILIFCFYLYNIFGKIIMLLLIYTNNAPLLSPIPKWNLFSNSMCYSYVYLWKRKFGVISGNIKNDLNDISMYNKDILIDRPIFFAHSNKFQIKFFSKIFENELKNNKKCFFKGYNGSHWPQYDNKSYKEFNNDLKQWLDKRYKM